MPKPEWGVKRLCPKTGRRFYDLNRDPIVSPYTGEIVHIDLPMRKPSLEEGEALKITPLIGDDLEVEDVLLDDDVPVPEDDEDALSDDTVSLDELSDVAEDEEET